MVTPIDPDHAYALVSDPDRRHLLALFSKTPVWTIRALASELAARSHRRADEAADEPGAPSPEAVRRKHVFLVHNHLPRLADHGIVEWDDRSGDVVRCDRFEHLESYLELASEHAEDPLLATSDPS